MVNTEIAKIIDNQVVNPKGLESNIKKPHREPVQIPLWFFKEMLNKDYNLPLTSNKIYKGENSPPLKIPAWLFRNLLRYNRELPMTVNQVASVLEVHPKIVKKLIKLGLIGRHFGSSRGSPRFLVADIIDALMNVPDIQYLLRRSSIVPSKTEAHCIVESSTNKSLALLTGLQIGNKN